MNTLGEIYQIWLILKDRLPTEEREEAASEMVLYLMDQGYELDDMAYQFGDDGHLKAAVKFYADDEDLEEEDDPYSDEWSDQDEDTDW